MKLVLKLFLLSTAILLTGAACTSENHEGLPGNPSSPSDGDDPTRREVVVILRNQLSLAKGTKAGEIATIEENKIASLDVYAFGSDTEDGTYTLQERFAYRENPDDLPATATPIDLEQPGNGKEASVSLKLQKGLFVKLYAVANQPELVDPSGAIGTGTAVGAGTIMQDDDFKKLILSNPGQAGTTVRTVGVPTETEFLTFHSTLLDAATPTDILESPLPMSGAYTIPLDLTNFESFSRLQAGFKLTRTVARFDVVNNAVDSRFTITGISMGNARRGTTFFPAKPFGTAPADPTDLIALPVRTFTGLANANAGITASAFYSYPSPQADNGYIVLEGTYRMNATDPEKAVSYQIPFKQEVNGAGSHIEVNPNHRYTITITKADDYHIDFDLTVADWSDAGDELDGFEPIAPPPVTFTATGAVEVKGDKIRVDTNGGEFTLKASLLNIPVTIEATPGYETTYGGSGWITIADPTTRAAVDNSEKTITIIANNNPDAEQRPHEVHIGYITVKWGKTPNDQKKLEVYRGASLVTYLDPTAGQTVRFAAVKMKDDKYWAPVNAGAKTAKNKATGDTDTDITDDAGKIFQWGRSYGFNATNNKQVCLKEISLKSNPIQADLTDMSKWNGIFPVGHAAISNNWLLFNGVGNPNPDAADMVKDAWYQQLWNANEGKGTTDVVKTSHDPCPEGWRVPTQIEWIAIGAGEEAVVSGTSWDDTNKRLTVPGKENGKDLLLPAAGYRRTIGSPADQGVSGNYWSSSVPVFSTNASYVHFDSTNKLDSETNERAYGYSVRCIRE